MKNRAFTLIELSIVLIIIGLLVGGVLVGRNLIAQAQIRSFVNEMNSLKTAVRTFELKYNGLPGDIPNATSFWPTATTTPRNGDGDGRIEHTGGVYEVALNHMSLAGLVAQEVIPQNAGSNDGQLEIGVNTLESNAFDGVAHHIAYTSAVANINPEGHMILSSALPTPSGFPDFPFISSLNMQTIDNKQDDGLPTTGKITAFNGAGSSRCVFFGPPPTYRGGDDEISCGVVRFYLD